MWSTADNDEEVRKTKNKGKAQGYREELQVRKLRLRGLQGNCVLLSLQEFPIHFHKKIETV